MSLYAFDAIDDAIDATRAFLWPFDVRRWAKLALVVFFIGGVGGFNPLQFGGSTPSSVGPEQPGAPADPGTLPSIGGAELAIVGAIIGAIVLLALVLAAIGAIMEFVFVESLRQESVRIRRYWSERWGQGLRLFAFRLVVGLVSIAIVGVVAAAAFLPVLTDSGDLSIALVLLLIPVFGVVAIVSGLVNGFTTVFVVPVMIAEDRGVLSAWRRFWPTMTGQWKQYGAYVVVGFILQIAAGIASSIAAALGAIVLAIPAAIVGFAGWQLLSSAQIAGWALVTLAVAVFGIGMLLVVLFVSVPVQSFLRYYALLVLGDTNADFDLIPERREAIRE